MRHIYDQHSDNTNGYTGYMSLSSSAMKRLSSPTIQTHLTRASPSIHSFPFFTSGGRSVSHAMRQEPFRLAPTNNYNPDRKQADGAYPVYDPPTAPPAVRMEVQSTPQTPRGRTKYNPPAYTEPTKSVFEPKWTYEMACALGVEGEIDPNLPWNQRYRHYNRRFRRLRFLGL